MVRPDAQARHHREQERTLPRGDQSAGEELARQEDPEKIDQHRQRGAADEDKDPNDDVAATLRCHGVRERTEERAPPSARAATLRFTPPRVLCKPFTVSFSPGLLSHASRHQ